MRNCVMSDVLNEKRSMRAFVAFYIRVTLQFFSCVGSFISKFSVKGLWIIPNVMFLDYMSGHCVILRVRYCPSMTV